MNSSLTNQQRLDALTAQIEDLKRRADAIRLQEQIERTKSLHELGIDPNLHRDPEEDFSQPDASELQPLAA